MPFPRTIKLLCLDVRQPPGQPGLLLQLMTYLQDVEQLQSAACGCKQTHDVLPGLALHLTGSKLADCIEQLELPALFDVVYRLRHLICRRLDKELEAKAIDIALTCGDGSSKSAAPIWGQE